MIRRHLASRGGDLRIITTDRHRPEGKSRALLRLLLSRLLVLLMLSMAFALPTASGSAASTSAPETTLTAQAPGRTASVMAAANGPYQPRRGVTFNSAVGGQDAQRTIIDKLLRTINAVPKGQEIKIFSWNYQSPNATDALLRAQARGVRVRLLMDDINNTEIANPPFRRLRAGLYLGNRGRRASRLSWAKTCHQSCRGIGGQAHAKFFMFSRVGRTPRVVIQGSANLTEAATFNQWNDVYTHVRNQDVWDHYATIFGQSVSDKRMRRPTLTTRSGTFRLIQFPLVQGRDPVYQLLQEVRCQGATNTASGVTRIRIAPDVIRNDRGLRLARVVRGLWNRGCDVKIGYTVIGTTIGRYLRDPGGRGPVPLRHLVQDFDSDGEFDNYFHLKAMSIVGHLGDDRQGYALLNGSANWSGSALRSDENIGIYRNQAVARAYERHIDYWYDWFGSAAARTSPDAAMRSTGRRSEPGALVFGTGKGAVYEDGTPYSLTGIDPYANVVD